MRNVAPAGLVFHKGGSSVSPGDTKAASQCFQRDKSARCSRARRLLGADSGIMDNVLADAEVEPGTLLVAPPTMWDANFRRTVVFVIDHREEGTLGVVLNRPSDVPVDDVLPNWGRHVAEPQAVFVGGPVEKKTALCLAALRTGVTAATVPGVIAVRGPVALVDLDTDPELLLPNV